MPSAVLAWLDRVRWCTVVRVVRLVCFVQLLLVVAIGVSYAAGGLVWPWEIWILLYVIAGNALAIAGLVRAQ